MPEKFEVRTNQEPYFEALRDLVSSIFSILRETPVRALGINHLLYYTMPDEKRYYELGNKLGSLSLWKNIFPDPRMFSIEIGELPRTGKHKGAVRVKIQRPDMELPSPYGVLLVTNDHFDINAEQKATELTEILGECFHDSLSFASELGEKLWSDINQ